MIRATYSGATGFLTSNDRRDRSGWTTRPWSPATRSVTPGAITDPGTSAGAATPYPSNIFVTGLPGQVTKVTASLKGLSHTAPIDFDILLSGPTPARNVILLSDAGGQSAASNVDVDFDDRRAGPCRTR